MTADAAWQPGDPLASSHGNFVRPMVELIRERPDYVWADAASWPTPRPGDDLDTDGRGA